MQIKIVLKKATNLLDKHKIKCYIKAPMRQTPLGALVLIKAFNEKEFLKKRKQKVEKSC